MENFDLNKVIKKQKLGEGAFGEVFQVEEKETGEIYAAKIIKSLDPKSKEEMINFSREINNNSVINHPSVLKFIGYSPISFDNLPKPVIITEFAKNGALSKIIELERLSRSIAGWNDTKKLITIFGIASGMSFLHSNEILHRDLKPDNILMDVYLCPKIADFGLSKQIHQKEESMTLQSNPQIKGTPIYIAPEIFENKEYTKSGDVYAFGMIVYEILTTQIPYKGLNCFQIYHEVVINGHRPLFDSYIEEPYRSLIERCWSQDPKERPSFNSIVEELKTNSKFITELIEKDDFLDYIEYIENYQSKFDKNKRILKLEDFIHEFKGNTFQKVDISHIVDNPKISEKIDIIYLFKSVLSKNGYHDIIINSTKNDKNMAGHEVTLSLLLNIQSMLHNSINNQIEFFKIKGFNILGFLFTQMRIQSFDKGVIEKLNEILKTIEYYPLIEQMISQIFLNIEIWIYFPIDFQKEVYKSVFLYFKNLPLKSSQVYSKRQFVQFFTYSKILYILRLFFWSSKTNKEICFCKNPKIDPITSIEIDRCNQKEINDIKYIFWSELLTQISHISFTSSDAINLCMFCFDIDNEFLIVDSLTSLIMLIYEENKILLEILKKSFRFDSFFPLQISPNDIVRSQIIHIFVLFSKLELLNQFSKSEWMIRIISIISTSNTSDIFADVVFGYLFNLFPQNRFLPVPSIRISKNSDDLKSPKVENSELLELAFLTISDFNDDNSLIYLKSIAKSIYLYPQQLLSIQNWYHSFIIFLIHRIPNDLTEPDESSKLCIRILNEVFLINNQLKQSLMFIDFLSLKAKSDFSYIKKLIIDDFLYLIGSKSAINTSVKNIYNLIKSIFEYICIIPEYDAYYLPSFITNSDSNQKEREESVTFKWIHNIIYNGNNPSHISYTYATRIKHDGTWIDANLAERFLNIIHRINILFNFKPILSIKEKIFHPLFMYSFILGIGFQHPDHFSIFVRYLEPLINSITNQKFDSFSADILINIMSGLIKCSRLTDISHQSWEILIQFSKLFHKELNKLFNVEALIESPLSDISKFPLFGEILLKSIIFQKMILNVLI